MIFNKNRKYIEFTYFSLIIASIDFEGLNFSEGSTIVAPLWIATKIPKTVPKV